MVVVVESCYSVPRKLVTNWWVHALVHLGAVQSMMISVVDHEHSVMAWPCLPICLFAGSLF